MPWALLLGYSPIGQTEINQIMYLVIKCVCAITEVQKAAWHNPLNSYFSWTDGDNRVSALREFLASGGDKLGSQAEA